MKPPLLEIKDLTKHYRVGKKSLTAIHRITFSIDKGTTLGVVGESGCGKSTLGKCLLRLIEPTSGSIFFKGQDLTHLPRKEMRLLRRKMQIIFQDPYSSLNPRMSIEAIVGEGLDIHDLHSAAAKNEIVGDLLNQVGLESNMRKRYPREFSGGQRQRIAIARALALEPDFIVCDEPISSLDVYVQGQILKLLQDLKTKYQLTYLFISHDLSAIRLLADRIVVIYLGEIVEMAPCEELFKNARHPYTQALLSANRIKAKEQLTVLQGDPPSPFYRPKGCPFHTRCPKASLICKTVEPPVHAISEGHLVSCHFV